jgi:5-formyltetrahydrofolate cyclo-ligase
LLIEGAGGLWFPSRVPWFVADLIKALGARVIIVSRNYLGSINHSLLTAAYCKTNGIDVAGWVLINEDTVYQTNEWGITEPKQGQSIAPQEIDLVFVPMLVCDQQGNRVGYGKGFYDRFLAQCREDVVKIGFSYFEPVERITDTADFDVPLTYCITPSATYEF